MRVITGRFRGMALLAPKGDDIRPTTDRVKEDVFNTLMPYINEDGIFLDLFCGTGAMAVEAVSRGFNKAELVDNSKTSLELAAKNTQKTKHPEFFRLIRSDAKGYLLATKKEYDIIFMDAPYGLKNTDELISIITSRGLLKEGGMLVVEKSSKDSRCVCGYTLHKEKKYSAAAVYYYKNVKE